jgi:hypothetical protein
MTDIRFDLQAVVCVPKFLPLARIMQYLMYKLPIIERIVYERVKWKKMYYLTRVWS